MGNAHPSLKLQFVADPTPLQVVQQVEGFVRSNPNYTVIGRSPGSSEKASIELVYSTPACGWLDRIRLVAIRVRDSNTTEIEVPFRSITLEESF